MNPKKYLPVKLVSLMTALSVMAGCGAESQKPEAQEPIKQVDMSQPITLKFFNHASNEIFNEEIGKRLKEKFPNITIQTVGNGFSKAAVEKLLAAGEVPDLFWVGFQENIADMKDLGLAYDLTNFINKDKYDLNRFEDAALKMVKDQGSNGEIFALPWQTGASVMFYNKDLFDKFNVPYPKDGMTWQETLELAKKLTRTENGVQYRGFDPGIWRNYFQQYGISPYDSKTGKSNYTTDPKWKSTVQFLADAYSIPGNKPQTIKEDRNAFMVDKTVAMLPWAAYFQPFLQAKDLNFDIVSTPTPPDAKGAGVSPAAAILAISPSSKYKEQCWEILKFLTSDEVETANSRIGFPPAIKLQSAKDQFGLDLPGAQSLNMKAVFYNKLTPQPFTNGQFHLAALQPFAKIVKDAAAGTKDVNTLLREAQEAADKAIQEVQLK